VSDELELKAVIPDPDALRERLRASGGRERFRARMTDRRFDRGGYDVIHAIDRDVEVYDVGGATVRLERPAVLAAS